MCVSKECGGDVKVAVHKSCHIFLYISTYMYANTHVAEYFNMNGSANAVCCLATKTLNEEERIKV